MALIYLHKANDLLATITTISPGQRTGLGFYILTRCWMRGSHGDGDGSDGVDSKLTDAAALSGGRVSVFVTC